MAPLPLPETWIPVYGLFQLLWLPGTKSKMAIIFSCLRKNTPVQYHLCNSSTPTDRWETETGTFSRCFEPTSLEHTVKQNRQERLYLCKIDNDNFQKRCPLTHSSQESPPYLLKSISVTFTLCRRDFCNEIHNKICKPPYRIRFICDQLYDSVISQTLIFRISPDFLVD